VPSFEVRRRDTFINGAWVATGLAIGMLCRGIVPVASST
jgi:hypothetical protein